MPAFASVYTGVAAGALRWTVDRMAAAGRDADPVVQGVVGDCHMLLESSRALIQRHVQEVVTRTLHALEVQEAMARCITVKHVAAHNAVGGFHLVRGRRIDYVLVRGRPQGPTLQMRSCERALVEPVDGVQASDHYGVFAELAVPERPSGTQGVLPGFDR